MNNLNQEQLIQYLSLIYDNASFIVTYKDPSLSFLYCNKITLTYLGYNSLDQVIGKSDSDFKWAKFADLYKKHEIEALNNHLYVALFPTCDFKGEEALVTCHRTPFLNDSNNVIGVLTHSYLLKDKKSLELSNILGNEGSCNTLAAYYIDKKNDEIYLTTKERECLFYFIRGKSCKMIGKILGLSPRTVEDYIYNIKLKFDCTLKNELLDRAIELGYLYDLPASLLNKYFTESLKSK